MFSGDSSSVIVSRFHEQDGIEIPVGHGCDQAEHFLTEQSERSQPYECFFLDDFNFLFVLFYFYPTVPGK